MSEPSNSPAVQSMREEQNRQRAAAGSGTLDKGLEATLPASDPVSTTITSIPAGRADVIGMVQSDRAADLPDDGDYPLVEEALEIRGATEPELLDTSEEVRALRRDVARLRENIREVAEGGVDVIKVEVRTQFAALRIEFASDPWRRWALPL